MSTLTPHPAEASGDAGAFTPIADYGLLADCNSSALVDRAGSIDWLCLPRYDSDAIFARLLDPDAGHWSIRPAGSFTTERRYLPGTLVIETTFTTDTGTVRLRDAMAFAEGQRGHDLGYDAPHELLRGVDGVSGEVELAMELAPRPEYGLIMPLIRFEEGGARTFGSGRISVRSSVPLEVADATMQAAFTVRAGERLGFSLRWASPEDRAAPEPTPAARVLERIEDTAAAWRSWEAELQIPRKRSGEAYFPSFLEPRRRCEQAIVAVVMEAYVNGVSTRKVDRLVEQLGIHGMTKDRVSALCRALDEQVQAFRARPLEGAHPYLWLDAKLVKVRDRGPVYPKALVIAYSVHETGRREVIGLDIGEIETEAFWVAFLRSLRERGLTGVRLCVSDEHLGLKNAIARVLGCPWQRCTVHFVKDMLRHCRPAQRGMVSAALREIFNADSHARAKDRAGEVIDRLTDPAPKVAQLLLGAEEDLLAFYRFPAVHWSKLRSTNPLERVNREIGRRSDVVGIFPNDASAIRLAGAVLIEQNDEWLVSRRYLSEESLALVLDDADARADEGVLAELQAA